MYTTGMYMHRVQLYTVTPACEPKNNPSSTCTNIHDQVTRCINVLSNQTDSMYNFIK